MKIAMIGVGAYSTALTLMLSKKENNTIMMWTENADLAKEFNATHKVNRIFPDLELPFNVEITTSYEEALKDASLIFLAPAAKYVDNVCHDLKPYYKNHIPICIASKGIEEESGSFLSDIVANVLETENVSVLSGPTFAIDMVNNEPIALALAGTNEETIQIVKENLANDTLKLRECNDLIGIQICGSIKNVIAIAAGMIKGLGYTESTLAFLINESLHDIKYLIDKLGGDKKTVLSFAGIGDLLLTCTSNKSRNYTYGKLIGENPGKTVLDKYLKETTIEGFYTLESIYQLLKDKNVKIPIINMIYEITVKGKNPELLLDFLVSKS